jgi:predicted DCC family thiol-disulfide oxidoreductase YuxK
VTGSPPRRLGVSLLLYDGTCGFCASSVQWVLRRDRRGTLCFAALQGETAKPILARHPELAGVDSVVWVEDPEGAEERVQVRSGAAIAVGWYLEGWWGMLATLAVGIPRGVRDRGYDLIARHRHKLTRNGPECLLPTAEERGRFYP